MIGRAAGENFPVAARVLPPAARRHLLAFYGYARLTDEIGDSYAGDRLRALDWLAGATAAALDGRPAGHTLVERATASVRELGLDATPLFDLVEANRTDQTVTSYPTFEDLLGYCAKSANPVGRLVLGAFGYTDPVRVALSDAVCTGLQLVEHWQDVREDAVAGRVYLPQEDLVRFGVTAEELAAPAPASTALRSLMVFESSRARTWLSGGEPLVRTVAGRPRWAVAAFIAGGHAALDGISRQRFDVLSPPRRPSPAAIARHLLRILHSSREAM